MERSPRVRYALCISVAAGSRCDATHRRQEVKLRNGLVIASAAALVVWATVATDQNGSTVAHEFLTSPVQQLALGKNAAPVPQVLPVQLAVLFQSSGH
jgi:hypothetical protein